MPKRVVVNSPIDVMVGEVPPAPVQVETRSTNHHMNMHEEVNHADANGFRMGSVVVYKSANMPRHLLLEPKQWGVVDQIYRYVPQGHTEFRPMSVRWLIDGKVTFCKEEQLILLVEAPRQTEIYSRVNKAIC